MFTSFARPAYIFSAKANKADGVIDDVGLGHGLDHAASFGLVVDGALNFVVAGAANGL